MGNTAEITTSIRNRYLDLLENALTGRLHHDPPISPWSNGYDDEVRKIGRDWPSLAQTMIGSVRMRNIRTLVERVIADDIPGDLLEAGVWRGGACIYMRGILHAHNVTDRKVWVCDSFAGLPQPDPDRYPADARDRHHTVAELAVSLDTVKENFARYDLLDGQVEFLPGWFGNTLPTAPIAQLAILRLDGDMYQSTIETLEALYHRVSAGGYVIIDDYILDGCRKAIHDFRGRTGIGEPIEDIDGAGVYWRRSAKTVTA
jgi:O-methyltransferase